MPCQSKQAMRMKRLYKFLHEHLRFKVICEACGWQRGFHWGCLRQVPRQAPKKWWHHIRVRQSWCHFWTWQFKVMPPDLHQDLENTVLGHSNSPKMEQFDWLIQMLQFKNLASASAASAFSNLPKGTLFWFKFLVGPLSLGNNGGFGFVFVSEKIFFTFINAKSTVSTFSNTIDVKVSIHECIFWGFLWTPFGNIIWWFLIIKYIHNWLNIGRI